MSTSIHLITQVRKNNIWEYVPEIPLMIDRAGYSTYAFLSRGVRDYFQSDGFEPKGLPEDLNGEKFGWHSYRESSKEHYESATRKKVRLPDGTYIDPYNERIRVYVDTEEEAKKHDYFRCSYPDNKFSYQDASLVGGAFVEVPIKELMSFDKFIEDNYTDNWDEEHQDYGTYDVDFTCTDFHSHSYLSLQELIDADKTDYHSNKVKVSNAFYSKFKELGGVLPEGMSVIEGENRIPSDIIDAIRMSYNPDVIISWKGSEEEIAESPITKGIEELKEIASKYDITDFNDIRIVFAFDN